MKDETLRAQIGSLIRTYGSTGIAESVMIRAPEGQRCAGTLSAGNVVLAPDGEPAILPGVLSLNEAGIERRFVRIETDDGCVVSVGPEVRIAGRRAADIAAGEILHGPLCACATVVRSSRFDGFGRSIEFSVDVLSANGLVISSDFLAVCEDLGRLGEFQRNQNQPSL